MSKSPYQTYTKEVAHYRDVDERTIQRHCKEGKIPSKKLHGEWRILTSWWEREKKSDGVYQPN